MNSLMQTRHLAYIYPRVYCKAVPNTITSDINAEFKICMLTILRRSLNYYKGHRTTMAPLLSSVPPSATINKAYPSFRPLLDYYPWKIESITPKRPYYIDIVTVEAQTLLLVEKSLYVRQYETTISFAIQFAKL